MKPLLLKVAKVYGALGAAAASIFLQQAIIFYFALESIIPAGLAKTVQLKHGALLLDGARTMPVWELPIAGVGLLWGSMAGSIMIILIGYFTSGRTFNDFHFKSFSFRIMFPWLMAYLVLCVIISLLENYVSEFKSDNMNSLILASRNSPLLAIVGIGIAVPFFEEIIFRGWLFKKMELTFGSAIAVISTSILFTLIHIQYNFSILSVFFLLAIILGMVRLRTKSIWPGIVIHSLNNIIATLLVFNQM